jgi:aspartate-semialdehyde dehydrogenase
LFLHSINYAYLLSLLSFYGCWCRELLSSAPGVRLVDYVSSTSTTGSSSSSSSQQQHQYPMPATATGCAEVEVGRLRQSLVFGERGLDLFVCGDQLLRGAALNAVLIAEEALAQFQFQ